MVGMEVREYTHKIANDIDPVYLAPNGRFHRVGCRYYMAPDTASVMVEGTFTQAFLENYCRLCFPQGLAAASSVPQAPTPIYQPTPELASEPEISVNQAPAGLAATFAENIPPLPPAPALSAESHGSQHRRRKKRNRRIVGKPLRISRAQILAFTVIVAGAIGFFMLFGKMLLW